MYISDCLVTDHQDNDNNSVVNDTKLQLSADCLRSASSGHRSVTNQASKLQVNTDITQQSTNYVNLNVTKEVEYKGYNVFVERNNNNNNSTCSTKRSILSAVSYNNPAFDSNISELQDSEHNYAQSSQLGPAVVSLYQSDLKNNHLSKHLCQQDVTRNVCCKRLYTTASIRLASAASTVPAFLESAYLEEPLSHALIVASDQEQEICDIDKEMVNNGNTNNSNSEDYSNMSDTTGSKIGSWPQSQKQVR
jgi:hypothetical protein